MYNEGKLGLFGESLRPVHQFLLISVCRQPFDRVYFGLYFHLFSIDAYGRLAFHDASATGFLGLKSHDDDAVFFIGKVMIQVVEHPAAGSHATC